MSGTLADRMGYNDITPKQAAYIRTLISADRELARKKLETHVFDDSLGGCRYYDDSEVSEWLEHLDEAVTSHSKQDASHLIKVLTEEPGFAWK